MSHESENQIGSLLSHRQIFEKMVGVPVTPLSAGDYLLFPYETLHEPLFREVSNERGDTEYTKAHISIMRKVIASIKKGDPRFDERIQSEAWEIAGQLVMDVMHGRSAQFESDMYHHWVHKAVHIGKNPVDPAAPMSYSIHLALGAIYNRDPQSFQLTTAISQHTHTGQYRLRVEMIQKGKDIRHDVDIDDGEHDQGFDQSVFE